MSTGEDILSKPQSSPDAYVAYGADPYQFFEVRLPSAKAENPSTLHPVLLNIHGGFWRAKYDLTHAGHLCQAFRTAGFATFNLEYRRVGNPGGGWPGTFEDIRLAYRFIRQAQPRFLLDLDHLVVMGHSAGGQLALCLAAHEASIHNVIALAGVVNLEKAYALHLSNDAVVEFLGGRPDAVPDHYREADPMHLKISGTRQWLIHGDQDDTVPPEFSRDYEKKKKKSGEHVELIAIPKAGHFDLIDPASEAFNKVMHAAEEAIR